MAEEARKKQDEANIARDRIGMREKQLQNRVSKLEEENRQD